MSKFFFPLLILALISVPIHAEDLTLWYDHPPDNNNPMTEGLPIGNGRMGGMVMGNPSTDRFQFNEDSLWAGDSKVMGNYQDFGDVFINLPDHKSYTDYRRELNLGNAVGKITYQANNVHYTREYIASHPADVVVIRLTADQPGSYTGNIQLGDAHNAKKSVDNNLLTNVGALPNGLKYESQVLVINDGGTVKAGTNPNAPEIDFSNCDSITIILGAGTNYIPDYSKDFHGDDPHDRVTRQVQAASSQTFDQLETAHEKDFQSIFSRVDLDLGTADTDVAALPTDKRIQQVVTKDDPELEELLYQYGRYNLISCSRNSLPANLQGLWNDSNSPPWTGDFHSDINIQMNYWAAESANMSECHLPLFNWMQSLQEPWRLSSSADPEFKLPDSTPFRGWAIRVMLNSYGGADFLWDKTANAWLCQHLWEHYAFGGDKNYLQTTAYPIMKSICEFWEDHLKTLPDSSLVVPHGWSPEHGSQEDGTSYNQEIVWDLFDNYVHAADALGIDTDYRNKIAAMRDKLVTPKIGKWGQLQEWMNDVDDPKDDHRHTSHLFAVYPGHQISVTKTPELAAAAEKSLVARGESGDSRREWVWVWRAALWARFHNPEKAHEMIVNYFHYNMLSNMIGLDPPQQWDSTFGITASITEMLLQSQAGEIELLPALPSEWPNGSVKGLCARGGFTVNMVWKNGKLVSGTIHSTWGTKTQLRYGTKVVPINLTPGATIRL